MKYTLLFAVLFGCTALFGQQIPDTTFHYKISKPAFRSHHPVVFIDEAHGNFHTADNRFRPLAFLLESDGFVVKSSNQEFTSAKALEGCDILVVSNALHPDNQDWIAPIKPAFTNEEVTIINEWVKSGGRLLLIGDHMPFAGAIQNLANSFEIEYLNGFEGITAGVWPPNKFAIKPTQSSDPSIYRAFLKVDSVATFTGSAIKLPETAISLLSFADSDSIHFTDTAWVFLPDHRVLSLKGYSQGGIMRYGKGKVAAFGEAAMFTAQFAGPSRFKVGFNADVAKQNCPFVLNLFYNLSPFIKE